jgi:folate-dependent phosphoribosylglycinamide formyltransferase PurN
MKIALFTGHHPRHRYLMNILKTNNLLDFLVIENRESHKPEFPVKSNKKYVKLFNKHFQKREDVEHIVFGNNDIKFHNKLFVDSNKINDKKNIDKFKNNNIDLIITTGIGVLSSETIKSLGCPIWNIHGGLSPQFKGAITHFWPSYLLKPQYTGCTIHFIEPKIDAGEIIHQTPAVLERGDGLHMLASKSLKKGYDSIITLIEYFKKNNQIQSFPQKQTGKLWLKKDWKPYHLEVIYNTYSDKIVDKFLDGDFDSFYPKIFNNRAFNKNNNQIL